MKKLLLLLAVLAASLNCAAENYILYTSSNGKVVQPYKEDVFGANIVSNTYIDGQGKIIFDGEVTQLGDYAFCRDGKLTSIEIPNSVTRVGYGAFSGCVSLTSVVMGSSFEVVGDWAFRDCTHLTSITSLAVTPPSLWEGSFLSVPTSTCILRVPNESLEAYRAAEGWKEFYNIVGLDEEPEEPAAKMLRTYRLSVDRGFMPKDNVLHTAVSEEEAGSYALIQKEGTDDYYLYCVDNGMFVTSAPFEGSHCFTHFPSGMFRIAPIDGTDRFTIRSSISGNMIQVDSQTWVCLNTWNTLDAGNQWTITECGEFDGTDVLNRVALAEVPGTDATTIYYTGVNNDIVNPNKDNQETFGANIIGNIYEDGMGRLLFDGPVTIIGTEAFDDCTNLKTVVVPEGVTELRYATFYDCQNLYDITLPNTLTTIGTLAFGYCI